MDKIYIYQPNGEPPRIEEVKDLADEPLYGTLKNIVVPLLNLANMERVNVLFDPDGHHIDKGEYTDMFVDEEGAVKRLPINALATDIYRANWMREYPDADPTHLPPIHGVAVVFSRKVWF